MPPCTLGGYLGGLPRDARLVEARPLGGTVRELASTQMRQSAPILSPGLADLLCMPGSRPWGGEGQVGGTGMRTWSGLSGP